VAVSDYDQLSAVELARQLGNTASQLVQKQIELAKQEAREDLRQTIRGIVIIVAGAVLLLFAVICLLIGLTSATGQLLSLALRGAPLGWLIALGALIWLIVFAAIGAVCLILGKRRIQTNPLSRTRASLLEDLEWVKQRLTPPES
jgi:hypothetical protein